MAIQTQAQVADGMACAVCEHPFAPGDRTEYVREQDVMVHSSCWEG